MAPDDPEDTELQDDEPVQEPQTGPPPEHPYGQDEL